MTPNCICTHNFLWNFDFYYHLIIPINHWGLYLNSVS